MAEWKMLVVLIHEGEYTDAGGTTAPRQSFGAGDLTAIRTGFAHFEGHIRKPLDSIGVTDKVFKPVFEWLDVKDVFAWKARPGNEAYHRMPEHHELVAAFPRWAVKQSASVAAHWFELMVWADHLVFVMPRPPGVGMNGADATWTGLDGKPLIGTMSIPLIPGTLNPAYLGEVIVHEWLHTVDAFLSTYHARDKQSVDAWQSHDPSNPKDACTTRSKVVELLRPDPSNPTVDQTKRRDLCLRGQTSQWDPHILDTYLHDTVFGGPRNNVIPQVKRPVPPPSPGAPAPPDKVYAGYDWDTQSALLPMYQDQLSRSKPEHWSSNLGRPSARLTLDGPVFGGEPKDFSEVEKVAIAALLTHLPPEFIKVLSSDGSVRIAKGERDAVQVRQAVFIDATTVLVDKARPPPTPLDLQKAVLADLARIYLRKRVGTSKIRDQLGRFPWSTAKGLPFWGRVSDDVVREWARLTPWKVRDRECTPLLWPLFLLFELVGWAEPDGFWGHEAFGAWVGLKHEDASTFATESPPADVYDDFADAVVVYVFGQDAYTQEGYFQKRSRALAPNKYDFIKSKVMAGREFDPARLPTPKAPVTTKGFGIASTRAGQEPSHVDEGPVPPLVATPRDFFVTPYQLREVPGALPTPDPAMVKALAHWDRAREGSPLHVLEEVQKVLRALPREEPISDTFAMVRLLERHGLGLLSPAEVKGFASRDVLLLIDGRLAVVVAVDAGGAITECLLSDPAASVLLGRETSLDARLVRFLWRPASEERTWEAGEGADIVNVNEAMRYLVRTCYLAKDPKYGLDTRTTPGAALLMLRELLHPADAELPTGGEAEPLAALLGFCESRGAGLRRPGPDMRPGDLVFFANDTAVGVVDRVDEQGRLLSVLAGGARLPDGRGGLAPLKQVEVGAVRHVWRPTLVARRWAAQGEAVAPLFGDLDGALNALVRAVGRASLTRGDQEVEGRHIDTLAMLAVLVDGGGTDEARAAFATLPLAGGQEEFRRQVADRGAGVQQLPLAPEAQGRPHLPRGAFVWFHDARLRGEALVGGVVLEQADGLPTKLIINGARLGRAAALALYEGPRSWADLRRFWVPTAEPRPLTREGAEPFSAFYGRTDEGLRRVLRYVGLDSVSDEGGTRRAFANPISLVQLLGRDAPEALRRQLLQMEDDTSFTEWRYNAFVRLLDTWGEGLIPPRPEALAPGQVLLLRDRRTAVVLSVDTARGTVEALLSGAELEHVPALPLASVEWVWAPSPSPRVWARAEEVSPDYLDINGLLNRLRRHEGYHELNSQYVRNPSGLLDSTLFLRSEFVSPSLKQAMEPVEWNDDGLRPLRQLTEALGEGWRALSDAPARVGDLVFTEQQMGVVMRVERAQPVEAMWTGRALMRGAVDPARVVALWTPSSRSRVWERPGEPVSAAYDRVSRFLNHLVDYLGLEQLSGGYMLNHPCGFVLNVVLKSDALSRAVRARLEQGISSFSSPARVCWECLAKLGKGLEPYEGQTLAPGDFVRTHADELVIVASTSEDGKPARAIRTQHRITLSALEAREVASFWRPAV